MSSQREVFFISYQLTDGRVSGYLCYTGQMTLPWLADRLFDPKLVILYISDFSGIGDETLITYIKNGEICNKIVDFPVNDLEALNRVWLGLDPSIGDTHILSFKILNGEFSLT